MKEIVDLTYEMHEGMLTFGGNWHIPFELTQLGRIDVEGRKTHRVSFSTHTGTQIDAPSHFIKNGQTIDLLSLNDLCGAVNIYDCRHFPDDYEIKKKDLEELKLGQRNLFIFGRQKYWNTKEFYLDYPYFGLEAAEYLANTDAKLIGFDSPSPDRGMKLNADLLGTADDSPIHKILLRKNIIILEYLANLESLTDYSNWQLVALPLKIRGADGSPARILIFR